MAERFGKITENTFIPISLVIVLLGLAAWVSTLKSEVTQHSDDLAKIEKIQREYYRTISRIDQRLSRIEGKLRVTPPPEDGGESE